MKKEGQRYQKFSRRAFMLAGLQGALMVGLGARLYHLSIVKGESYRLKADNNRLSLRLVEPIRGEILDRFGRKIATNRQDYRVFLVPEQSKDIKKTLAKINRIVPLSERKMRLIERTIKRQRGFMEVTVASGLTRDQFARLNVAMPDLEGITPDSGLTRHYPYGPMAAHLVGYVGRPGEADVRRKPILRQIPGFKIGREGLERRYEEELQGKPGTRRIEVNAFGREIRELKPRQEALNGDNVALTLDMELQQLAAEKLGEEAAAAVVMKAKTGEILALASSPSYDPNDFNSGISSENWNAILKDPRKPLLNKALSGQYPPGSTVKMVVALAALEYGIITEKTKVYCNGSHKFGDRTYHCWERRGHGRVGLLKALSRSCDIFFYKLAEQLDVDDLAKVSEKYGLGTAYDIGLTGSSKGIVPTRAWKKRTQNASWYGGETLNVAIGQGAMTATPLQLAVMTARLATGKQVMPTLRSDKDQTTNDDIDKDTSFAPINSNPLHLRLVREGMHNVMRAGGTAHDYRNPRDSSRMCGKTGTAQVRRISMSERQTGVLDNDELAWKQRDHALFVGYLPADDPEYIVSILVQHGGGGSSVAAPIGRSLLMAAEGIDTKRAAAEKAENSAKPPARETTNKEGGDNG